MREHVCHTIKQGWENQTFRETYKPVCRRQFYLFCQERRTERLAASVRVKSRWSFSVETTEDQEVVIAAKRSRVSVSFYLPYMGIKLMLIRRQITSKLARRFYIRATRCTFESYL